MVRIHNKAHHHHHRAPISPLDKHSLRIKSPKLRGLSNTRLDDKFASSKRYNVGFVEESPLNHLFPQSRRDISYFGGNASPGQDESDSEDELFQWEEEETLVNALLQNESTAHRDNYSLMSLVDSLQPSFTAQGTKVLHDLAESLVPAAKRVRTAHRRYERDIDPIYAQGLLSFDSACQAEEAALAQTEDSFKNAYQASKDKVATLFLELEDLYAQRRQLWTSLREVVEETDLAARENLQSLPARTERVISDLEKRSKSLAKDDQRSSKDEAAYLKSLINKLA